MIRSGRIIKAHNRSYDDPIQVKQGEVVHVTKRELWNEDDRWAWCITESGKEGWIPVALVDVKSEQSFTVRDYDGIELNVAIGDTLTIWGEIGGWYMAQTVDRRYGWVPVECVALDLM
ncbi:MAG: hypothetical protein GC179_13130 [Anaerolineaceae bacterium]|nr:hypothetical protein [Anaerolineaceae bacterium]